MLDNVTMTNCICNPHGTNNSKPFNNQTVVNAGAPQILVLVLVSTNYIAAKNVATSFRYYIRD